MRQFKDGDVIKCLGSLHDDKEYKLTNVREKNGTLFWDRSASWDISRIKLVKSGSQSIGEKVKKYLKHGTKNI